MKQVTSKQLAMQHQDKVSDTTGMGPLSPAARGAWVETLNKHTYTVSEGRAAEQSAQPRAGRQSWGRGYGW